MVHVPNRVHVCRQHPHNYQASARPSAQWRPTQNTFDHASFPHFLYNNPCHFNFDSHTTMTAAQHRSHCAPIPGPALKQFLKSGSPVGSVTKGKRSKRPRHAIFHAVRHWAEDEEAPCSSLSEEEDLANCLVMLSSGSVRGSSNSARNFQCKTCNRNFHSYQALGGHSASHSKFKSPPLLHRGFAEDSDDEDPKRPHRTTAKIHECSVCGRIFPTGQALGGHMRSHSAPSAASHISATEQQQGPPTSGLPDLNMPPPVDDVDDSALSYSPSGDMEDPGWPGLYCTPPWELHGTRAPALVRYSDEADASSGMLGGQDLGFQQGSALVATVN